MSICSSATCPVDGLTPIHTLEETAQHLYERGLTRKPLDKGGMLRFERRLMRKLRRNPTIRALYRERFGRVPDC